MWRTRSRGRRIETYDCLVSLKPNGTRPPLFLICWEGGRLVGYRELIAHLPDDLPVYGLRAPRFDGRASYPATLEELAARFLAEIRRFRPEPPYLLGGYCFGGALAHEIARQLDAATGEPAAFLGLIESSPYGHGKPRRQRPAWSERQRIHARRFAESDLAGKTSILTQRLFGRSSWWRWRMRQCAFRVVGRLGWSWPSHIFNLEMLALRSALFRYVVPASNARITLFEADDPDTGLEPNVWAKLAGGGVDDRPISAAGINHLSIMRRPYVELLARAFEQRIAAALRFASADESAPIRPEAGATRHESIGSLPSPQVITTR